jgi:hypothetical protein
MNFDFKNVPEDKKYVGYGVNQSVNIISVESGESQNEKKTPFIQINLKITGDADENNTIQKLYITDRSQKVTMRKIMAIHSCVSKLDLLISKDFASTEELAKGLNSMWSGRNLRLKLQAEEYEGTDKDGNPKIKARTSIPLFDFCEPLENGAELPPVAEVNSKLVFDKTNKNDFRRLAVQAAPAAQESQSSGSEGDDDMPF